MTITNIGIIVGSLRKESINRKLADALIKLAPPDFAFKHINIGDLPLYNQDDDGNQAASVKRMKSEIEVSQGLLFVTPEYNRSMPGVLKNALDHGSRPYGASSWNGKPAGVIGITPGALGTAIAQQHLRAVLVALNLPTMPQPEAYVQLKDDMFEANGTFAPASKAYFQKYVEAYIMWVRQHAKA